MHYLFLLLLLFSSAFSNVITATGVRFFNAGLSGSTYARCSFSSTSNSVTANAYDGGGNTITFDSSVTITLISASGSYFQTAGGCSASGSVSGIVSNNFQIDGSWSGDCSGTANTEMRIFCSFTFEVNGVSTLHQCSDFLPISAPA